MVHTNKDPRERLIQEVKDCGQDLIDNAESLVGDIEVMTDLSINIQFSISGEELPMITVRHEYYSKNTLKRLWDGE